MELRKYGLAPYRVVVEHGGPGAAGEMMPVAKQLAKHCGVLEPLHMATSIDGQCQELKTALENCADLPCVLIGHSWGGMLSFIFSALHPEFVSKLILVSSGPFEESYVSNLMENRSSKYTSEQQLLLSTLLDKLDTNKDKDTIFAQLGALDSQIDTYDPLPQEDEDLKISYDIYSKIWPQAKEFRKNGSLLQLGKKIKCPVLAIHGDYDSHPADGVRIPLSSVIQNFRFVLLTQCGHYPWRERKAREEFFKLLDQEIL